MNRNVEIVKSEITQLLGADNSGHGMDHIERVVALSKRFLTEVSADETLTLLIAYLHDADDYKLVGKEAEPFANTRRILNLTDLTKVQKQQVIDGVATIGYSTRLKGIVPYFNEAAIVSDADMCDASGASGILRAYQYSLKFGKPFFDANQLPNDNLTLEAYQSDHTTTVNHLFEKILKLKDLMLTQPGKAEGQRRHEFVVSFLEQYFKEQQADQWITYLHQYLKI